MKKYITRITTFFMISLFLSSCYSEKSLLVTPSDNNQTYKIDYLFEHDGCKVYRFYDRGNYVYFTNCNGEVTSISNDSLKTRTHTIIKENKN